MEIKHFGHKHKLTFLPELSKDTEAFCQGCGELISDSAYVCEDCLFWLHKSCAELPGEIQYRLHTLHPLTPEYPGFICDSCRNISGSGFFFNCSSCQFNLDAKCALLINQQRMKQRDRSESTIHHFCHKHKLNLCNFGKHSILAFCCCCNFHLNNYSLYCCIDCRFFIHESCLNMQQEVQHPLHPQHPLFTHALINNESRMCDSCDELVEGVSLRCTDCEFYVHIACRNPLTRTLKHKCHEHDVVYFLRSNALLQCFECNKCHAYCSDSFYRCNECNLNLHLECIPLPGVYET